MENENITNKKSWGRILYMILFAVVLYIVICLVGLIALVQVVFTLFSGNANNDLKAFSVDLSNYIRQIVTFLLFIDNRKPFPFNTLNEDDNNKNDTDEDSALATESEADKPIDDEMHSSR